MKKFFQSKGFIVSSLALLCVSILGVCWFVSRDRTGDFRPDESPPSSVTRQFRRSLPHPPSKRRPAMTRFPAPATEMELYTIQCLAGLFPAMYSSPPVTAMGI